MRMPPLPADFIHARACKLKCEKILTRPMTELMEHIFGLPEVQRAVRHMEITHINQANRGKELKANGTIPLHSNPNETQ